MVGLPGGALPWPPRRFCGTQFSPAGALPDRLSFYLLILRTAGGQPWPPQTWARVVPLAPVMPAERCGSRRTRDHAELPHAPNLFLDFRVCECGLAQSRKVCWAFRARRAQARVSRVGRAGCFGVERLAYPPRATHPPIPLYGRASPVMRRACCATQAPGRLRVLARPP